MNKKGHYLLSGNWRILLIGIMLAGMISIVSCIEGSKKNSKNNADVDNAITEPSLLEVKARPEKGFYWDYLLFVPKNISHDTNVYLLVESNNTGTTSDDISIHHEQAKNLIETNIVRRVAVALNTPLLVPVFPRTVTRPEGAFYGYYSHALSRDTLLVTEEKFRRVDLQLIAMIEDAQELLRADGIQVNDKIFMHGFSASASFLTRFLLLHPEKVRAAVAGGLNGMPILPVNYWKKWTFLRFPIGISDLYELTDIHFNLDEYRKVSQYLYMGYLDKNDTLPYIEAYHPEEAEILWAMLGDDILDRWSESQLIYEHAGIDAQFVTYNATGHNIRPEIRQDIIQFFKENSGESIVHIEPHQYDYEPYGTHEVLTINKALWLENSDNHLSSDLFSAYIDKMFVYQGPGQFEVFHNNLPEEGRYIYLTAEGYDQIKAQFEGSSYKIVMHEDGSEEWEAALTFVIVPDEIHKVVCGVTYTLEPVKASDTYYISVEENVTLIKDQCYN